MIKLVPHAITPDLGGWHPWYAWYPVKIKMVSGHAWVWREMVYRRGQYMSFSYSTRWKWEYTFHLDSELPNATAIKHHAEQTEKLYTDESNLIARAITEREQKDKAMFLDWQATQQRLRTKMEK